MYRPTLVDMGSLVEALHKHKAGIEGYYHDHYYKMLQLLQRDKWLHGKLKQDNSIDPLSGTRKERGE